MSASTTSNQARAVGFLQSGSGAIARTMQAKARDIVSVADYDTGAANKALAIQAAMDAMNAASGGIVHVPRGNYSLTTSPSMAGMVEVELRGEGPNATSLIVDAASVTGVSITGLAQRCRVRDLWIGAFSALASTSGIVITGTSSALPASEIIVENVNVQNVATPINITDMHQSKFARVRVLQSIASAVTGVGLHLKAVISSEFTNIDFLCTTGTFGSDNVRVDQDCDTVLFNHIEAIGGTTGYGIRCLNAAGTTGPRLTRFNNCYVEDTSEEAYWISAGRDIRFRGCHAATSGMSGFIITGGDSITFTDCLALQNDRHGFFVTGGTGVSFSLCAASNNSQETSNTYDGIRVEDGVSHVRLIGNRCGDFIFSLANVQRYGISLGSTSDYVICKDNDCQGNGTADFGNFSTGVNNDIDEDGTFTITLTGFATPPTGTARFRREGRQVTLYIPALSGTSNATTCTLTGAPTNIRPARAQAVPTLITDNGTNAFGWGSMATGGTITLYPSAALNASGWTGSGTKAIVEQTISYSMQ